MDILQRFLGGGQARQDVAHRAVKQFAFVGQGEAARMALEQGGGDFFFQGADLAAHRRLAESEHLTGMGEASGAGDGVEDTKLVPVHGTPPGASRFRAAAPPRDVA